MHSDYCTDEMIRQVTINCAERGLLLLRVRDELRMSLTAYQTLYESSIAYAMRKALEAEQGKSDMEAKVRFLPPLISFLLFLSSALSFPSPSCLLSAVPAISHSFFPSFFVVSLLLSCHNSVSRLQQRADCIYYIVQLAQTEEDKKELERQVQELKAKIEFIEKRENERRGQEEKKHADEVAFLKRTNVQLKTQLESILKKN